MWFFEGASGVVISGGNLYAVNAAPGSTVNIGHGTEAGASRALTDLSEAAAHTAMHDSAARFDAPRCHRNTRSRYREPLELWMLGNGEDFEGKQVIWLHGGAGVGKSAIMQSAVEQSNEHGVVLGTFFFSRADASRNYAEVLVPTLAYQVACSFPEAMVVLDPIIKRNPLIFKASLHTQAVELLVRPLLYLFENGIIDNTSLRRRVFFIDGLDECNDPHKQALIIRVVASIICDRHLPISFVIASRPEIAISSAFEREKRLHAAFTTIDLDNDNDAESDIRRFIENSFLDILDSHPLRIYIKSPWPHPDSIDHLVWKSSSHFIYAATAMRFIASPDEHPGRALKVVEGLEPSRTGRPFAELDALYTHILTSAKYSEQVLKILGHRYVTDYPSTVVAICHVHNMSPDDVSLFLSDAQSLVSLVPGDIGELYVYPKHASLGDFLMDVARSQELYIARGPYHASLLARHFQLLDDGLRIPPPSFGFSRYEEVRYFIFSLGNALEYSQDTNLLQSLVARHSPYDIWNFCIKSAAPDATRLSPGIRSLATESVGCYIAALRDSVALHDDALYSHQVQSYMQLVLYIINDSVKEDPQFGIIPALIFSSGGPGLYLACKMLDVCDIPVQIGRSGLRNVLRPLQIRMDHRCVNANDLEIDPRAFEAVRQMPQNQFSWSFELTLAIKLILQQATQLPGPGPSILHTDSHRQQLWKHKRLTRISLGFSRSRTSPVLQGMDRPKSHFPSSHLPSTPRLDHMQSQRSKSQLLLTLIIIYLNRSNRTNEVVKLARRSLPIIALWHPSLMKRARAEMDAYVCRWQDSLDGLLESTKSLQINDMD